MDREWTVAFGKDPIARHCGHQGSSLLGTKHLRPDAEPAATLYRPLELAETAGEPVQNRRARPRRGFETRQHLKLGAAAMNRADPAAGRDTRGENMLEDAYLCFPAARKLRSPVESDLSYLARRW